MRLSPRICPGFAGLVMEGHRAVDDGSAQRLTAVMEIVRDHLEATKRAYGRPRSLDLSWIGASAMRSGWGETASAGALEVARLSQ